jgi:hypothetical protein
VSLIWVQSYSFGKLLGCRTVNDLVEKDSASILLSIITTFHVLQCNNTMQKILGHPKPSDLSKPYTGWDPLMLMIPG